MINILPFGSLTAATTVDESLCNKHYEAAIKLKVDTPIIHYFSVSKDATTGKEGRVIFSSGNLQYSPSYQHIVPTVDGQRCETIPNFFRFAPRQIDRVCDGRDITFYNGNVWYDTIIKSDVPSVLGGDSFYAAKRKCTNGKNATLCVPDGITNTYHGWVDLFPWGASCQGKRAKDPGTTQFKPYEFSTVDTKNTANPYGIGPSYYASPSTNNPTGWQTDVKRNNIDTSSGLSRYFDWGYANVIREYTHCTQIKNGKTTHTMDSTCYRPGVWRTLTNAEWTYVMKTRKVENSTASWTYCRIEDTTVKTTGNEHWIIGLLLYPDDYNSTMVDAPKLGRASYAPLNTISITDFEQYEKAGCIFLPSAYHYRGATNEWGCADFNVANQYPLIARYWTSTVVNATAAYHLEYVNHAGGSNANVPSWDRATSTAVRLVQDIQ